MVGGRHKKFRPQTLNLAFNKLPEFFTFVLDGKLAGHAAFDPDADRMQEQLHHIASRGVKGVVCLLETPADRNMFTTAGLEYLHLPTPDLEAPSYEQLMRGVEFITAIVNGGGAASAHCQQGVGRTGCLLAAFLISHKAMQPDSAIKMLRDCRPGSVHKQCQVDALHEFHARVLGITLACPIPTDPYCHTRSQKGHAKWSKWEMNPDYEMAGGEYNSQASHPDTSVSPTIAAYGSTTSLASYTSEGSPAGLATGMMNLAVVVGATLATSPCSSVAESLSCTPVLPEEPDASPTKMGRRGKADWGAAAVEPAEEVHDVDMGEDEVSPPPTLTKWGLNNSGCEAIHSNSNSSEAEATAGPSPDRNDSPPNLLADGGMKWVQLQPNKGHDPNPFVAGGPGSFPRMVSDPTPPLKKTNTSPSPVHNPQGSPMKGLGRLCQSAPASAFGKKPVRAWSASTGGPVSPLMGGTAPPPGYNPNPGLPPRQRSMSPSKVTPQGPFLPPRQRSLSPSQGPSAVGPTPGMFNPAVSFSSGVAPAKEKSPRPTGSPKGAPSTRWMSMSSSQPRGLPS